MDVRYINPFLKAIREIFDTMIDLPLTLGKPVVKNDTMPAYEISGSIGLSGGVTGCVVISLSEEIALQVASALLGEEIEEVNTDCTDAVGEIANMIAGNAKNDFPEDDTSISVPSIVIGKDKMTYPTDVPIISIPCETGNGSLVVDVALAV